MNNNKKNIYIIILSIIIFLLGIIFIIYGLNFKNDGTKVYSYKAQKSDNYEVLLKPNNFYSTEKLPAGGYYASNSINSYIINLKYDFEGNKKANIDYNYNIIAELVGIVKSNDNIDKEVWNRSFLLKDNSYYNQENTDNFSVEEAVNIDYPYYYNLAHLYEKTYQITIDTILKLRLNISYNINSSDLVNEKIDDFIELDIPITNTVSEIKENYQNVLSNEINSHLQNNEFHKIIFYAVGALFIIISISIIIILKILNKKNKKEIYIRNINHIIKYYKDLIVKIANEPDLTNLKTINISIFEDLIDIAEQTQNVILHYESLDNVKNVFYVIIDNLVYIYNLHLP